VNQQDQNRIVDEGDDVCQMFMGSRRQVKFKTLSRELAKCQSDLEGAQGHIKECEVEDT
jgi:hypothetical protein